MKIADYCNICGKAIALGSFTPLFRGDKGFSAPISDFTNINMPTDWENIICFGIYNYFNKTKNPVIPKMCYSSLIALLKGNAFEIWCAYNVFFLFVYYEKTDRATFRIIDDNLIKVFKSTLVQKKTELKQAKVWQGEKYDEGLWTDIASSAKVLKNKYGIVLL